MLPNHFLQLFDILTHWNASWWSSIIHKHIMTHWIPHLMYKWPKVMIACLKGLITSHFNYIMCAIKSIRIPPIIKIDSTNSFSVVIYGIMLLISKMEMSVINKMADVFLVNFITGEPWYLAK